MVVLLIVLNIKIKHAREVGWWFFFDVMQLQHSLKKVNDQKTWANSTDFRSYQRHPQ